MKIENLSKNERPREKLAIKGVKELSDTELLALIIGTGNKNESVLDLCNRIIKEYGFEKLFKMDLKDIKKIKGIGDAKASILISVFEVTRRIILNETSDITLREAKDLFEYVYPFYYMLEYEVLTVIYVDSKLHIIKKEEYTSDGIDYIDMSFKKIIGDAINLKAFGIFLVHNHPQGSLLPSDADINSTRRLINICDELNIHFFDHLIIARGMYYSFSESLNNLVK